MDLDWVDQPFAIGLDYSTVKRVLSASFQTSPLNRMVRGCKTLFSNLTFDLT